MPIESFQESPDGDLYCANGFDPVLRWDGLATQMEQAGLDAPLTGPSMATAGRGSIVGTYYAYVRFLDAAGNVSNLSPISSALVASAAGGSVSAATNATPIVVTTSAAHGLTSGSTVKIEGAGGNQSVNGIWTVTVLSSTTFSLTGSSGAGTYNGGATWSSGVLRIDYSGVVTPSSSKVRRRQVLRNTDGQTDTFYVDVDTTNLSSSTLSSTRSDSNLAAQTAQPLFDSDGNPLANRHHKPPNYKGVLANHLGRMFLAVDAVYDRGSVQVTKGSSLVYGVGTEWTKSLANRLLYVAGARRTYTVSSASERLLVLTETYKDETDLFAKHAVKPTPSERKLVYFSEASLPQSWPPTNAISVQDDGDEITGLMPMRSFLYILEKRHLYKLTFQDSPLKDGAVFMAANRGCINNRCWVVVDDVAYMLDELGVHKFMGRNQTNSVSDIIQELFRPGADTPYRINWRASEWFHAKLYAPQETIRWFVAMDGAFLPRHALCFNYRFQRWWVEEYPLPIGGACEGSVDSVPEIFYGCLHQTVLAAWHGTLDIADPHAGTTRGTATSSGVFTLTDTAANFDSSAVNSDVFIVEGKGKGQKRRINASTSTELAVCSPWLVRPDDTSKYQIGGVRWKFKTGWFRFTNSESNVNRRLELVFDPLANEATMDFRFRIDFNESPQTMKVTMTKSATGGMASKEGETDFVVDLTTPRGLAQKRFPGQRENFIDGRRFVQFDLGGVQSLDVVRLYQLMFEGAQNATAMQPPQEQGGGQ